MVFWHLLYLLPRNYNHIFSTSTVFKKSGPKLVWTPGGKPAVLLWIHFPILNFGLICKGFGYKLIRNLQASRQSVKLEKYASVYFSSWLLTFVEKTLEVGPPHRRHGGLMRNILSCIFFCLLLICSFVALLHLF